MCNLCLFFLFFFRLWIQKTRGNFDIGNLVGGVLVQKGEVFLESWIKREFDVALYVCCMMDTTDPLLCIISWSCSRGRSFLREPQTQFFRRAVDELSEITQANKINFFAASRFYLNHLNNKQSYNHKRNNRTTTMVCLHDRTYVKQQPLDVTNCTHILTPRAFVIYRSDLIIHNNRTNTLLVLWIDVLENISSLHHYYHEKSLLYLGIDIIKL